MGAEWKFALFSFSVFGGQRSWSCASNAESRSINSGCIQFGGNNVVPGPPHLVRTQNWHGEREWKSESEKHLRLWLWQWSTEFGISQQKNIAAMMRAVECVHICLCSRIAILVVHHHTRSNPSTIPICPHEFTHILQVSQVALALNTPTVRITIELGRAIHKRPPMYCSNGNCCQREIGSIVNFYCSVVKSTGIRLTLALQ